MSSNYSLQQNLASAMGQAPDPFTQAKSQQQMTSQVQAQSAMPSPFPDWNMGQAPIEAPTAQPKLADIQAPVKQASFQDLAKQMNLDIKGLSNNPQLGKLQILQRMGQGFEQHPQFKDLMSAWDTHASSLQADDTDMLGMSSRAKRTLAALVGAP